MNANCDTPGTSLLSVENACEKLVNAAKITATEKIPLTQALERVLAEDVLAPINVPPAANSAMDGYAVNTADFQTGTTRLLVSQRIAAGEIPQPLYPGTAARIFTGAPIPPGANAIIMQENAQPEGEYVVFRDYPNEGQFVRNAGEDIIQGATILKSGIRLRPQHLGLIASIGVDKIAVFKKPRVTLFSTGDELVMPGNSLPAGKIFNSNHFTLMGLLQTLGCDVIDGGTLPDSLAAICNALTQATQESDVILTSGGASVGEADHLRTAMEKLGRIDLWRIAVKPGKPLAFGYIGETPLLGLPGNPVSVFVTFCLFARPYFRKCMGLHDMSLPLRYVQAGFAWPKPGHRREFLRARLDKNHGIERAVLFPNQGSGILTSAVWSEGLIDIAANSTVMLGQSVPFLSFNDLLYT